MRPAICREPASTRRPDSSRSSSSSARRTARCFSPPARAASTAIYTEHLTLVHIIRKVLLRVSSYLDYIIIKHSISLGH